MARKRKPGRAAVIDAGAKVAMLAAVREGRRLREVAACYGVTLQAFYSARRRDPLFAAAWRDAHALSAEAERRCTPIGEAAPPPASPVPLDDAGPATSADWRIAPNNRRLLQRRKMRHVRFDERRKGLFLARFARSCDLREAAAGAGVCERTVFNHRRLDPAFAAAFQAALDEGYEWLGAEAASRRLEAQRRLRDAIDEADAGGDPLPLEEEGAEFERTMRLLARWERRHGPLGPRQVRGRFRRRMSFEEAILLLEKRLANLGLLGDWPPPGAGEDREPEG